MLKLDFNTFQKKLEEERISGMNPTVHSMIKPDSYVFVMKSTEKWDYYAIVTFKEIMMFSESQNIDPIQAIDMFVTNYLSNTTPIQDTELDKVIEEVESIVETENVPENVKKQASNDEIDAGEDMIIEAQDYSDFLLKFFDKLEKNTLSAIDNIDITKSYILNKQFGNFLKDFFNNVNTVWFAKNVRRYIKIDLVNGMTSSESELNIDIGFNQAYEDKLNVLSSQQIDGYMINGKKWFGIKGVTKEIQADIIKTVQNGINEAKSLTEIKDDVKGRFDKFSDWRSEMIARTETTRITNEGKILGYKESGIKGQKVWSTALDKRTSEICKRLNGQTVALDDMFIDPETRKGFQSPPSHPHCRSTIYFRPE